MAKRFDIHMANPHIFHMPMELGLEFVTVIRPNGMDAEGESRDNMIDKMNGIFLSMFVVNL